LLEAANASQQIGPKFEALTFAARKLAFAFTHDAIPRRCLNETKPHNRRFLAGQRRRQEVAVAVHDCEAISSAKLHCNSN
jgi:hypothetical protein